MGRLWAYVPGYPMLMRAVGYVIFSAEAAGRLVSLVCALVALVVLARLTLHELGDEASASFGCWLLALLPYAVFLTSVYTESTFLAPTTVSLFCTRRGGEVRAALGAAVAVAVGVTGLVLIPALVVEHLLRRRGRARAALLAVAAVLAPPLLFAVYAWGLTGDPLAFLRVERSALFHRGFAGPGSGARRTFAAFISGTPGAVRLHGLEPLFEIGGLGAIVWMALRWRRISPSLTVHAARVRVMWPCLIHGQSVPRHEMTVVPLYVLAADVTRRHRRARVPLLMLPGLWSAGTAALVATGRFVA